MILGKTQLAWLNQRVLLGSAFTLAAIEAFVGNRNAGGAAWLLAAGLCWGREYGKRREARAIREQQAALEALRPHRGNS